MSHPVRTDAKYDLLADKTLDTDSGPPPCPVPECGGFVHAANRDGIFGFICDGVTQHRDSEIRSLYVRDRDREISENEAQMEILERRVDPIAWIKNQVLKSSDIPMQKFISEDLSEEAAERLPAYSTGFCGNVIPSKVKELKGMTTLSGRASSGKSWFALGAALRSAEEGWDVHYLAAEGKGPIGNRVRNACHPDPIPERFHLKSVNPGVTLNDFIEMVVDCISSDRTLLIIDSISTFKSLMSLRVGHTKSGDDQWEQSDLLEIFLMRLRELTEGAISIINISEMNAKGETKGRVLDHRSDTAISFTSEEGDMDSQLKEVRITKAWNGPTGMVGLASTNAEGPGLALESRDESGPPTASFSGY